MRKETIITITIPAGEGDLGGVVHWVGCVSRAALLSRAAVKIPTAFPAVEESRPGLEVTAGRSDLMLIDDDTLRNLRMIGKNAHDGGVFSRLGERSLLMKFRICDVVLLEHLIIIKNIVMR
eukprot:6212168-Pleurochrysis_carterae.AAC.3